MSAKMEKHGGYDYQFVDEKKLPNECTCPICTLVQREAHQVTCCGKIYCKSCLDELKSKRDNFNCPNCRNSLEGEHKHFPGLARFVILLFIVTTKIKAASGKGI